MRVFKFGGASVKDAEGVKNVVKIILQQKFYKGIVVISAMGKMTNAFEKVVEDYCNGNESLSKSIDFIHNFHYEIMNTLFSEKTHSIFFEVERLFGEMQLFMAKNRNKNKDFIYDQIVPYGEFLSTTIVSAYLKEKGVENEWLNAMNYISTNSEYRTAEVDWDKTQSQIEVLDKTKLYITQGFIGGDKQQNKTTLGREGSDYTAAIFAYCLSAEGVTIWKDVAGVLNADPRFFPQAVLLNQISYEEAIEMAFYGASVIHPKTLKPLQNKNIPLFVKSFENLDAKGTVVKEGHYLEPEKACYIVKKGQHLISVATKDFSFMVEDSLSAVFKMLHHYKMKVNVMQNSAISFLVCIEDKYHTINELQKELSKNYKVEIHENCTLYTIRHLKQQKEPFFAEDDKVLLKQQVNDTLQMVVEE
ncbi:MAG: aspartate kinase [Flavobacteriaceae bacterium]|nr:aspartate kinase [Flavobacteriaceae bacterium]